MTSFAIVRYNHRTFESGGVVAVVRGEAAAQKLLLAFEGNQGEENSYAGWRYFIEETDLAPGMEPEKASRARQARLDRQDSRT